MLDLLTLVVSDAWRGKWSCAQYGRLRKTIQGYRRQSADTDSSAYSFREHLASFSRVSELTFSNICTQHADLAKHFVTPHSSLQLHEQIQIFFVPKFSSF
jgi:hypothetical protein